MIHDLVHKKIVDNKIAVDQWFQKKSEGLQFPFYSSFDIRDSGNIIAPVDANVFPAGFNNICQVDQENSTTLAADFILKHYGDEIKTIAILAEEHTNNLFYWNNVAALEKLLKASGKHVLIALPKPDFQPLKIQSANGDLLDVYGGVVVDGNLFVNDLRIDLIISNNDFSDSYENWIQSLKTPINPPHGLGWHQRKKSDFFDQYNKLACEFSKLIDLDDFHLQVKTKTFQKFDVSSDESRARLAEEVDAFIEELKEKYKKYSIDRNPYVFIKNNSGTYGLGVIKVMSGQDVINWNYKSRKKMKASKGGKGIGEVIIQEGIPTRIKSETETAEPAIYMIGCKLAGGFLRTHGEKDSEESLNSPGAVFKRLCVSDLNVSIEGAPMENVYGWLAKLGFLAIAYEANSKNIPFLGYKI